MMTEKNGPKKLKFKTSISRDVRPADPESLFRDLKDRSPAVQHLWSHQADLHRAYDKKHIATPDMGLLRFRGVGSSGTTPAVTLCGVTVRLCLFVALPANALSTQRSSKRSCSQGHHSHFPISRQYPFIFGGLYRFATDVRSERSDRNQPSEGPQRFGEAATSGTILRPRSQARARRT